MTRGRGGRCWWLRPGGRGRAPTCMYAARCGGEEMHHDPLFDWSAFATATLPCPPPPHAHPTPGPRSAFCHTPLTSDPFWRNKASACMSVCAVTQTELHVARTAGEASGPPRMGKSLWPSPFKQHPLSSTLFMRVWRLQTWHRFPGLGCAHPHACPRGA